MWVRPCSQTHQIVERKESIPFFCKCCVLTPQHLFKAGGVTSYRRHDSFLRLHVATMVGVCEIRAEPSDNGLTELKRETGQAPRKLFAIPSECELVSKSQLELPAVRHCDCSPRTTNLLGQLLGIYLISWAQLICVPLGNADEPPMSGGVDGTSGPPTIAPLQPNNSPRSPIHQQQRHNR
ncbi:hypothetical protein G5I_00572 [Acromyrmex echinatior]|uniref:Uncharacterized protein n=1 Tax=Acromyrmex echinatior TaxID=103372 RepID=F4W580_ACREC|nr:hypothetical protein G5I_00572 [Acromyrmex echinatior]